MMKMIKTMMYQQMQAVHYSHHINVIISAGLNEMLVCCHPTVIHQLGLVDWREVCFVWPQPIDRYIYFFGIGKDEKNVS